MTTPFPSLAYSVTAPRQSARCGPPWPSSDRGSYASGLSTAAGLFYRHGIGRWPDGCRIARRSAAHSHLRARLCCSNSRGLAALPKCSTRHHLPNLPTDSPEKPSRSVELELSESSLIRKSLLDNWLRAPSFCRQSGSRPSLAGRIRSMYAVAEETVTGNRSTASAGDAGRHSARGRAGMNMAKSPFATPRVGRERRR